jgi:phosphatidylglycerol:prolipoprotein diacylglycerol transferase
MLPYVRLPAIELGPITLHPFGLLVATAVFVGTELTLRRGRKLGYDVEKVRSCVAWMVATGFVLSHVLDSLAYHWDDVVRRPWSLLMIWENMSSFGGFIGAVVGLVVWKYFETSGLWLRRRARPLEVLSFADLVLSVYPIAWIFGRTGCVLAHDHPGIRAASALAVAYPSPSEARAWDAEGRIGLLYGHEPRFDMALFELAFTVVLAVCYVLAWRRRMPTGTYVIVTALAYAPARFAMDFLRASAEEAGDPRYAGLTPGQWACIGLFAYGIFLLVYTRRQRVSGSAPTERARALA